ncbi:hypothetical protein Tco_0984279 [Tanacetum coccineum]
MSRTANILQYSGLVEHQESSEGQRLPFPADLCINKLASSVGPLFDLPKLPRMAGLEPITPLNEGTSNQNSKSIIDGARISSQGELLKEPSNRNLIKPMLLDFDDSHDISDDEIQDNRKGKAKVDEEDLSKPFKEVLKCPFTRRIVEFSSPGHRMPANVKIYNGTGNPEDHVGRFVGIGN